MQRFDLVRERNCWRRARCHRLAFLVDGEAYFRAVAEAIERAHHTVMVIGWDFDPRIALRRDTSEPERRLGELLLDAVERRPELWVRILNWDFALIYALTQPIPLFAVGLPKHRRIRIRHDGTHPPGASHHQKVVVVDDQLAFVGGVDLTRCRWDTSHHRAADPGRIDPRGQPYGPFHDVQVAVDGEAAAALGDLARRRWWFATGQRVPPVTASRDPWPLHVAPDVRNVEVGLARTEPGFDDRPEVREVERLWLDAIASAQRWIYIENQYFTSATLADAIAARLQEPGGPEIIMALPRDSSGWLEQTTMDGLRAQLLGRLRSRDRFERLRVYYPVVDQDGRDLEVYVHAKVMIVDDAVACVGSANLSNRSLGLDTECNLVLARQGGREAGEAITTLLDRLVGEHVGASPGTVRAAVQQGSLITALDALNRHRRGLRSLPTEEPSWLIEALPDVGLLDPERPIDLEDWLQGHGTGGQPAPRRWNVTPGVWITVVLGAAIVAAVRLWTGPEGIEALLAGIRGAVDGTVGPLLAVAGYLVGSLLLIPSTLVALATVAALGPGVGFGCAFAGAAGAAVVGYLLGRMLHRDTVRRLSGVRLNQISQALHRHGVPGMIAARLQPRAPFALVNLVAGASGVDFRQYIVATALGLLPQLAAVTLCGSLLVAAVRAPTAPRLAALGAAVLAVVSVAWFVGRLLSRPSRLSESPGSGGSHEL